MERQTLRDAVVRLNAEELTGLAGRPKPTRPPQLTESEKPTLFGPIFRGPDSDRDGVYVYSREDVAWLIERHFGDPARRAKGPLRSYITLYNRPSAIYSLLESVDGDGSWQGNLT